ncbi:MAG: hypothetical protein DCC68_00435 [Planctomycetota bacterium]|nr:MAG: hypothetical protein DCC68_00435 [Planctomycetota bacterium]
MEARMRRNRRFFREVIRTFRLKRGQPTGKRAPMQQGFTSRLWLRFACRIAADRAAAGGGHQRTRDRRKQASTAVGGSWHRDGCGGTGE